MSANGERPPPPDVSHYHENRNNLSLELMTKYAGKYVALSPDGTRIIASGDTEEEMEANVLAAGIHPSQVVGTYVDEPGTTLI